MKILQDIGQTTLCMLLVVCCCIPLRAQKLPEVRVNQADVAEESLFIEANRERLLGNYDNAESKLNTLIEKYGEKAVYHYERAKLFHEIGDLDKAHKAISTALDQEPSNEWYWQFRADIGIENENHEDVIFTYEKLADIFPDRHYYLENIAFHQLQNNDPEASLKTLNRLEKKVGINYETTRQKHIIYDEMGDRKAATEELDRYLISYPEDERILQSAASYVYQYNDTNKATEYYQKLLDIDPDNAQAKSALLKLNALEGRDNYTLPSFMSDQNVSLDDKIFHLIPILTDIQLGKSEVPIAKVELMGDNLLKQYGNDAKVFALRGDIFSLSDKLDDAIDSYMKSIAEDDGNYLVWESLLYLLSEVRDQDQLAEYAEEAIDIFPNKPMPHAFLAISLALDGDFAKANQSIEQAKLIAGNKADLVSGVKQLEMQIAKLREQ